MQNICPFAKDCYIPSGDVGWIINVRPLIKGVRKEWIFLIKYPSEHPSVEDRLDAIL